MYLSHILKWKKSNEIHQPLKKMLEALMVNLIALIFTFKEVFNCAKLLPEMICGCETRTLNVRTMRKKTELHACNIV